MINSRRMEDRGIRRAEAEAGKGILVMKKLLRAAEARKNSLSKFSK
jgi:hypothetical protein